MKQIVIGGSRHIPRAAFIIAFLALIAFLFIISNQTTLEINYLDNFWYLNRARLIWRGILPDLFVYTLTYPTLVGVINLVVNDVILAGMLVNAFLMWCILMGVYLLGCWLYADRRVAWLAVIFVFINPSLGESLRLFWATIPFTTATIWCVIAAVLTVRRPGIKTGVLLGTILALATYTRIEGALYTLLILAAVWMIFKRNGLRLALQVLIAAGVVFTLLCIPFALNYLYVQRNLNRELSTAVMGIFTLFDRTPVEWAVIWRRFTDTLTGFLSHWSSFAWLIGIAGLLWASPRYRAAQWICAALIALNLIYTFVLAIWPYPVHVTFYLPLFGLIAAAAIVQLAGYGRWGRILTVLALLLALFPSLLSTMRRAYEVPVLAYRTSELASTASALDTWLVQQGWYEKPIYTFCGSIISFSRAPLQLIYRMQFTTGWDTPALLLPKLRQEDALLMVCGNEVFFPDWHPLLQQPVPNGMHEVGRFDSYIFYRPNELT